MRLETKEVYVAWDGKEFLDQDECVRYESENLNPIVQTKLYLHGSKESNYHNAKDLELSDSAAAVFCRALYEVEFKTDVNRLTGESYCTHVFGQKLETPVKIS